MIKHFIIKIEAPKLDDIHHVLDEIKFKHSNEVSTVSFTPAKIRIDITESDLEELRNGTELDWTFRGVDIHLYNPEAT